MIQQAPENVDVQGGEDKYGYIIKGQYTLSVKLSDFPL
jgi:hypothetical protein